MDERRRVDERRREQTVMLAIEAVQAQGRPGDFAPPVSDERPRRESLTQTAKRPARAGRAAGGQSGAARRAAAGAGGP